MTRRCLPAALGLLLLNGTIQAAPAAPATIQTVSEPAAKAVEHFHDALLGSMKNAKVLGTQGRYAKLAPAVDAAFDFGAMTEAIVGPSWSSVPAVEQRNVISAFRRMTIASYAKNFDDYNGEQFIISPQVQDRAGEKVVSAQMTAPGKEAIAFIYRLDNRHGDWKIDDVFLNGYVSEVATRRADFASTLRNGGAGALVQKLNTLSENLLKG